MSPLARLLEAAAANLLAVAKSAYPDEVQRAVDVIAAAFERGNKLLVFGNGGSAADAQHICAELVVRFTRERRGLPAIALTCNPSTMTACGNDYGFARVFQRQIEALGRPGDVAWGISTSGNSPNIVEAMKYAQAHEVTTVGLTGAGGGAMAPWCDVLMAVPLAETPRIQEVHLVTYHSICDQVEERIFRAGNA